MLDIVKPSALNYDSAQKSVTVLFKLRVSMCISCCWTTMPAMPFIDGAVNKPLREFAPLTDSRAGAPRLK